MHIAGSQKSGIVIELAVLAPSGLPIASSYYRYVIQIHQTS
jgi:hypothetical protein